MIDIIGDPALNILQYLDCNSIMIAIKVSQTWHDEIVQHKQIFKPQWIQQRAVKECGSVEVFKILIDKGAQIDARDQCVMSVKTARRYAAEKKPG